MTTDDPDEFLRQLNEEADASSGKAPVADSANQVTIHWENMASLRYWGGALVTGLIFVMASALIGLPASVSTPLFWVGFVIALIAGLVGRRYWCPYCRGMVKNGATVCRHCGREFEI
jgi:hypothetical protein